MSDFKVFEIDGGQRLRPRSLDESPGFDHAATTAVNLFLAEGFLHFEQAEGMRAALASVLEETHQVGTSIEEVLRVLACARDAVQSTSFQVFPGMVALVDTESGAVLAHNRVSEKPTWEDFVASDAVIAELLLEVLLVLMATIGTLPAGAKKAVKQTVGRLVKNERVRVVIGNLISLLRTYKGNAADREGLRRIFSELFEVISADLGRMIRTILRGMGLWEWLLLLAQIAFALTPAGWVVKGGRIGLAAVTLAVALMQKWERFKEGKALEVDNTEQCEEICRKLAEARAKLRMVSEHRTYLVGRLAQACGELNDPDPMTSAIARDTVGLMKIHIDTVDPEVWEAIGTVRMLLALAIAFDCPCAAEADAIGREVEAATPGPLPC